MLNLKQQIQEAAKDMASKLVFSGEDGHHYTNLEGQWLQGVSTVSNVMPKDWLAAWGAKEAVKALGYSDFLEDIERAEEMLEKIKKFKTAKEYVALLKEVKGAAFRKSKEALLDGKRGHEWLELYCGAMISGTKIPEIPKGDMLERPLTQFVEWAEKEVDYWILSEAQVIHERHKYAGTLDAVAMMKNGRSAVIDFKFASHISPDYHLQLAGYKATFESYGLALDDRIIVRLPKTLTIDEWDKENRKYRKVENSIEIKIIDTDYEFDRDTFVAALPVKQWINKMKELERQF